MSKQGAKIQRVELSSYHLPVHCPFCGTRVHEGPNEVDPTPCRHTLFIAHDEGFEYRSERFDQRKKIVGVSDDEFDLDEGGYDAYTDDLEVKDAVKFAIYVPAPSGFGAYYGFAPLENESA